MFELNTLWPRQKDRHFADYTIKRIFVNKYVRILISDQALSEPAMFPDVYMRHSAVKMSFGKVYYI